MDPDDAVPIPDLIEQEQVVDEDAPAEEPVRIDGNVPVADALEQAAVVQSDQVADRPDIRADVPVADALEQSIEVPVEDEY